MNKYIFISIKNLLEMIESSIDNQYDSLIYNFKTNTWYKTQYSELSFFTANEIILRKEKLDKIKQYDDKYVMLLNRRFTHSFDTKMIPLTENSYIISQDDTMLLKLIT